MTSSYNQSIISPILGDEVAEEVLQWIGAYRTLTKATIISYNMQDYEFWGNGRLSRLLGRQLAYGAEVVVMTTPPPGKNGHKTNFRKKLVLLEELQRNGVQIYLHERLHAKAYLFLDSRNSTRLIVGSPNLTSRGFGQQTSPSNNLLELALLTGDPQSYSSTLQVIESSLVGASATLDFASWVSQNRDKVAQARGVM